MWISIKKYWYWWVLGLLFVIGIILWFWSSLDTTEKDTSTKRSEPQNEFSQNSNIVNYNFAMKYPDPAKISTMKVPNDQTNEPNLILKSGYRWQFDTDQNIKIGYRSTETGNIISVDWYPNMDPGYTKYFPVGTKKYYVYGGDGQATLTTFVVSKR